MSWGYSNRDHGGIFKLMSNPKEIADTIYRLAEAMNELPLGAQATRDEIKRTIIVSLCKLLTTLKGGTMD